MSYNKIFNKVPVQIQNRSGFDLSHENIYTMPCGTLIPILVDQLIPGDHISLGHLTEVQLPPMATDFYGRVQFKVEAFFVPNRLCYAGFQNFITQPTDNRASSGQYVANVKYLPMSYIPLQKASAGSLADYLGLKNVRSAVPENGVPVNNILPFVAYHLIWQDYYRDSLIQKECFLPAVGNPTTAPSANDSASYLPYVMFQGSSPKVVTPDLADGFTIFDLRQRCWSKDYFTNAKPRPQAGTPATLSFNVDGDTGSFTIASLRAANTLQQWMERQNLAGSRYIDQIRANFGVTPSDAVMARPVYLGSHSFDIYNKSIYQSGGSEQETRNPMAGIGSKFSSPLGVSDSSLVDGFSVNEYGYLMVLASIVPEATYSSGQRRYLDYQVYSDFANPLLSAVGDQEIKNKELALNVLDGDDTFGYTQRYSEYKFMLNEVHGLLVDGQSLESFALQRSFDSSPNLSSSFLQIPTTYLDQVSAVTSDASKYGAWADTYFTYKKSSVLPAYSIPTLGEPKDTHTEIINNGGTRL